MSRKPDDRPKAQDESGGANPEIYVIVDGKKFPKPGLETLFADVDEAGSRNKGEDYVVGVYCSCNKVCTCIPQAAPRGCSCVSQTRCSCVGQARCSCDSHRGGGSTTGCRCAPVH
ncbi:MAG: hypothetical protein C4521_00195 [Actinobacteria bacterium]|nr:MAG: hypothetical protein C4521_00195 [Actinomycetota bacterium]